MTDELSKGFTGIEINGVRFSNISEMLQYMDKQRERITNLEKENAELKEKAGCIIEDLKALYFSPVVTKDDLKRQDKILAEAEQFIKDSEVEK